MSDNNEFNIETADLSSNMILEASAGTGKTYSLEHLFIRYILESGISVKEILVVTFTEKAASELKKRIKALLRKKLSHTEAEHHLEKSHILKKALYDFNEAPIFTIHGFCQNCLSGFPVESGLPFDFKIMKSGNIYEETVLDYFRTLDIDGDDEYLSFRSGKSSFDECFRYFVNILRKDSLSGGVNIYPDEKCNLQYEKLKKDFSSKTGKIYDTLQLLKELDPDEELITSINNKLKLRINANFRPLLIELFNKLVKAETLSEFFSDDLLYHFGRITKLTLSWLDNNEKDISLLDENEYEFVLILDSLFLLPEGFCFDEGKKDFPFHDIAGAAFIIRSMKILNKNLYLKKMKNSELDFSDLIKLTRDAVMNGCDSRGKEFKEEIRRKYKIVMIDEFQDTDNLQWEIFSSIFFDHDRRIILIGDPKQSIYRFRGADIEVYFKALNEIKKGSISYMLETNYRSEKRVVEALNKIFEKVFSRSSGGGHPIDFTAVKYLEEKDKLLEKGGVEFLAVENDEKFKADDVSSTLETLFAAEIKNLLESESVQASDICILLESNEKCRNMYKNLVSLDIPAVYEGDIDLFESDEIHIVLDFLSAVSSPLDRGKIIKTLISPLFDFQFSDLPPLDDDYSFEKLSSSFYRWKEMTDRGELSTVLAEVTGSEKLFPQLSGESKIPYLIRRIAEIGGERKITNFDHIGEILINRNRLKRDNSSELLSYLISVMEGAENEDEKLTRLERDDKSVRIMTIHKSKGLEFPVVFFGGGFTGDSLPKSNENYYEYVVEGQRYVDLVKKSENKLKHYYEQWEEKKRLYYVAFTRAEQKLYLPLFKHSSLNYISDIYGLMVYDLLVSSLKEIGICPEIPFAGMALPGKMKRDEFSDIISEKIYQLILENFNDCELFTVNTELYSSIPENGLAPFSKDRITNEDAAVEIGDFPMVFKNAAGNYDNKNISLFSYSSIVRAEENRTHYSIKPLLLGENSPGDDELVPSSATSVSLDASGTLDEGKGDETAVNSTSGKDKNNILKGPLFGNLMHTLLEKADYQKILKYKNADSMAEDEETRTLSKKISKQFLPHDRIDSSLSEIMKMLYKTIHGSFSIPGEDTPLFIGQLEEESRRHELEFLLKIKEGSGTGLLNLPSLHLDNGYIKGFIDLIFLYDNLYYIADWKTNYLGNKIEDYQGENLETAMEEHNYYLQMKLYMTALARIISVREGIALKNAVERIGGCYYFFLRGLDDREKDSGVYFSLPDSNEIIKFSDTFFEDVR